MNDYETADGDRFRTLDGQAVRGPFPRAWGRPPDDPEDRAGWIKARIREGEAKLDRGEVVKGQRVRTGRQALASLGRRRLSPDVVYQVNRLRLRLLDLKEKRR